MGIDNNSLRFILDAKKAGVDFTRTVTIGRQNFYRLTPALVEKAFVGAGMPLPAGAVASIMDGSSIYTEGLFQRLGAQTVDAVDYSPYENASLIHDMNTPVPREWHERCTTVIDGGSLEHIFNFPVAIANCMRLVAVGGHFIGLVPANNFFGHGFYQFSAELYYRVFAPENGFEVERMVLAEDRQDGRGFFEVVDPAKVQSRVTVMTAQPCHLFVLARKTSAREPFSTMPYQSDYVRTWEHEASRTDTTQRGGALVALRNAVKNAVGSGPREWLRSALFPGPRSFPRFFKRV